MAIATIMALVPVAEGLVTGAIKIISVVKNHPSTPAEDKAMLDALERRLSETAAEVAAYVPRQV